MELLLHILLVISSISNVVLVVLLCLTRSRYKRQQSKRKLNLAKELITKFDSTIQREWQASISSARRALEYSLTDISDKIEEQEKLYQKYEHLNKTKDMHDTDNRIQRLQEQHNDVFNALGKVKAMPPQSSPSTNDSTDDFAPKI